MATKKDAKRMKEINHLYQRKYIETYTNLIHMCRE